MNALLVDGWLTPNHTYRLSEPATAFAIYPGTPEGFGPLCELPAHADVEVCSDGFNDRTVKVRYGNCYYFVFWRDLATATDRVSAPPLASA
jgi:hypothetical protein